jgi:hypothetical protein
MVHGILERLRTNVYAAKAIILKNNTFIFFEKMLKKI